MEFKILYCFTPKSVLLTMALEVGRHKAEVMLIQWLSNQKIRQSAALPKISEVLTADILTKPAVVPAFILFRLEFEEH